MVVPVAAAAAGAAAQAGGATAAGGAAAGASGAAGGSSAMGGMQGAAGGGMPGMAGGTGGGMPGAGGAGGGSSAAGERANMRRLNAMRQQADKGGKAGGSEGEEEGEADNNYTLFDAFRDVVWPFKFGGSSQMKFVDWFNEGLSSNNIKRALVWVFLTFGWYILAVAIILIIVIGPWAGFIDLYESVKSGVKAVVPGI